MLRVVVENGGRLLEKDVLMLNLRQESFIEENNLTANIKMLRRALGDNNKQSRFIEIIRAAAIVLSPMCATPSKKTNRSEYTIYAYF